jgi:two-component system, NarL family, nitrate/nitrite response regulator NarL
MPLDPPSPVKVLIMGLDPLARTALATALEGQPGVMVVGQVEDEDDAEASEGPRFSGASVLLWDMGPAARDADPIAPETRGVQVLALASDQEQAERAISAGAAGVIERDGDGDRIAAAARALDLGLRVVSEAFAPAGSALRATARPRPREGARAPLGELTPREHEVLRLLAEGLSNRQLARRLGISEHTAKFHVNAILEKLDASSRTEAVVQAARLGLLRL